jgi:hypothetical protein
MATEETNNIGEAEETPAAPHALMSEEEASALQREIILSAHKPDYVMPDGRTNRQIWEARASVAETDRKEAEDFERRSLEANTPRVGSVAVRVEAGGQVVVTTHEEAPAKTQLKPDDAKATDDGRGDALETARDTQTQSPAHSEDDGQADPADDSDTRSP